MQIYTYVYTFEYAYLYAFIYLCFSFDVFTRGEDKQSNTNIDEQSNTNIDKQSNTNIARRSVDCDMFQHAIFIFWQGYIS